MTDQQDAMHTLAWEKMQAAEKRSPEMVTLQVICTELRTTASLTETIERIERFSFDEGLLEKYESLEMYKWFLHEARNVEREAIGKAEQNIKA